MDEASKLRKKVKWLHLGQRCCWSLLVPFSFIGLVNIATSNDQTSAAGAQRTFVVNLVAVLLMLSLLYIVGILQRLKAKYKKRIEYSIAKGDT